MFQPHILMCAFALLVIPVSATASSFGDLEIVHAREAMARGDDGEALYILYTALQNERAGEVWSEARFIAARVALEVGRADLTLRWVDGLDKELPEVVDFVRGMRAHALRRRNAWSATLVVWKSLVKDFPDSPLRPEAFYSIADAHYALGRLTEARAAYVTALRIGPRLHRASFARFNVGRIDEIQGRFDDAASTYRYIAFRKPSDPLNAEATKHFEALVRAGKAKPLSFRSELATIDRLISRHLLDKATAGLDDLDAKAVTEPRKVSLRHRRAQVAYRARDFETAIATFTELMKSATGHRKNEYKRSLARCYSATNQNDKAIALYHDLADRYRRRNEGKEALFKAAWLAYNARQHARAVKMFGEFIERYPDDRATDEAMWYLAWNAFRVGDIPTAVRTLDRLRNDFPTSKLVQRTHYWKGRMLERVGVTAEARTAYRAAIDEQPLSYYGAMSQQRLNGIGRPDQPIARRLEPILFASASPLPDYPIGDEEEEEVAESHEPASDELPEAGGLLPLSGARLPWGGSVLDWNTPEGARALRLMKLGLNEHAARLVRRLPTLPGHDTETISYARARILYALGDYNAAYVIGATVFKEQLKGRPDGRARRFFHLAYPNAHIDVVNTAAGEFNISPFLILSVMRQESAFRTTARSWASAQGLMQIIPPTGRRIADALGHDDFSIAHLNDPSVNVRFGAWYLSELLEKFHGNLPLAIASYNAGPKAVTRWVDVAGGSPTDEFIEEIPYRETRHYVKRVLANFAVYNTLHGSAQIPIGEYLPTDYRDNINF